MPFDPESLAARFRRLAPAADHVALRVVEETSERVCVRQDVALPPSTSVDRGAMLTVIDGDGIGYAATSDCPTRGCARR